MLLHVLVKQVEVAKQHIARGTLMRLVQMRRFDVLLQQQRIVERFIAAVASLKTLLVRCANEQTVIGRYHALFVNARAVC